VVATLAALARHPGRAFSSVPEPIRHARALAFLATLRLPAWGVLLAVSSVGAGLRSEPPPWGPTALGRALDPALVEALSLWLLLLVPLGVPLLYFALGIAAHVGLGLTGGARQSIGATMRATGITAGPLLLCVSLLDLALHLGAFATTSRTSPGGPEVYGAILGACGVAYYGALAAALARTHGAGLARALLTAVLPALLLVGLCLGRALLELPAFPFLPTPEPSPYAPIVVGG
jgi:hypothetical protein